MDKICRFCLKASTKRMCSLEECDILYNIQKFLTIEIPTEDSFPQKICKGCFRKVSQLIKFCITLKENEDILQQYLKTDQLRVYYTTITNKVKQANNEKNNKKIETCYINLKDETDIEKQENDNVNNIQSSNDMNDLNYSSDDDVKLSYVKERQELSTSCVLTEPVKITKFTPLKSLNNYSKMKSPNDSEQKVFLEQFSCLTCLEPRDSQHDLIKHYREKHLKRKIIHKTYTEHGLDGTTTFSCDICEKTFDLKRDVVKHVIKHSKERPLTCQLCARTYKTVSDIIRHARAHNGIKLKCPFECGFTTVYEGSMKDHTTRHLEKYKYTCEKCGKGFNTKTWFEQHQNIHTGKRPFVCNICGLAFPMARYLHTHKASRHPQSSGLKRYSCVRCGEKCDSAKSLALHMEEHGKFKENDFLCDFCGKILRSAYQLKYHNRMHMGVKPFSCSICKKKFAKKYNVQLHMKIHLGNTSHPCTHCEKVYSQRSTLLRHIRIYHPSTSTKAG